ncbi:hypothetical protein ZHAS_00020917 [Anopheles sinensis]|uniref:Uncharacterized protein n=1 Tax=Anopheles sinensis TaxID=74873 RepID=A0A084WR19_ANOSI|nr:hypothetical protein ZHAS_00020917 [Anopheles sinensis]
MLGTDVHHGRLFNLALGFQCQLERDLCLAGTGITSQLKDAPHRNAAASQAI